MIGYYNKYYNLCFEGNSHTDSFNLSTYDTIYEFILLLFENLILLGIVEDLFYAIYKSVENIVFVC